MPLHRCEGCTIRVDICARSDLEKIRESFSTAAWMQRRRVSFVLPNWYAMVGMTCLTVLRVESVAEKKNVEPSIPFFEHFSAVVCCNADFPDPAAPVMHSKR